MEVEPRRDLGALQSVRHQRVPYRRRPILSIEIKRELNNIDRAEVAAAPEFRATGAGGLMGSREL